MSRSRGLGLLVLTLGAAASPGCGGGTLSPDDASGSAGRGGADNNAGAAGTSNGGGTGGSCGAERLTAAEATTLYTTYAFEVQPSLNPAVVFEARELEVAGLWEGLNAQLFYVGSRNAQDGSFFRDCTVLIRACQVVVPAGECSQLVSPLSSGLVANGAFYFSWGAGSGVYRSQLGKLAPSGAQLTRSVSAAYVNANEGPPPLVLQLSGADILVQRARDTAFNEWSSPDPIGKLEDLGDRLTVVDDAGQAIGTTLP